MKLILNLTQIEDVVKVRFELGEKFLREKIYIFWQFNFFWFNCRVGLVGVEINYKTKLFLEIKMGFSSDFYTFPAGVGGC